MLEVKKSEPLVSIVLPTYNSKDYVKEALDSILHQNYENFEVIVVDDKSRDGTLQFIHKYTQNDPRFKLITKITNQGVAESRNIGINESSGKYVAFLDSDDWWLENKLKNQVNYMEKNKSLFTYGDYAIFDETGINVRAIQRTPEKITYTSMLRGNMIGASSVMINVAFLGKQNIINLKKRNDFALWLRYLTQAKVGNKVPGLNYGYRKRGGSLSSGRKTNLIKYHYELYRWSERFGVLKSSFYTLLNIMTYFYKRTIYFERKDV